MFSNLLTVENKKTDAPQKKKRKREENEKKKIKSGKGGKSGREFTFSLKKMYNIAAQDGMNFRFFLFNVF